MVLEKTLESKGFDSKFNFTPPTILLMADTTLIAESKEELKSRLMKVKEESEKVGLKVTFRKLRCLVPPLHGKQWKQCQALFFWAPKSLQMVTAAMKLKDTYSLEGKL